MAGYHGYSMSNNAVLAYETGEKPYSRWKKKDILEAIEQAIEDEELHLKCDLKLLKKIPAKQFKEELLTYTSWHHTSSHFNETDFYSIDYNYLANLTDDDIQEILQDIKPEEAPKEERWECEFLIWGGTKSYPTSKAYREEGIVKGSWFYRKNGTKKKTTANGFKFIRKLD